MLTTDSGLCVCLTCTFRASCCSTHLSREQVPGEGGVRLHWLVQGSSSSTESVAGGGWFEVLWNLECLVGLSQKRNMWAFQ